MIYTLTLNPCLDRYLYVNRLVEDDTIRAHRVKDWPAGKGIDVSRAIKEIGGFSVAIALLGGDTGRKIEEMLDEEGVVFATIRTRKETRMNVIVVEEDTEKRYRFSLPFEVCNDRQERVLEVLSGLLRKGDWFVVSGSLPKGFEKDFYRRVIELAKSRNVRTLLDSSGQPFVEGLKASPDVIKPNHHEIKEAFGWEADTPFKAKLAAQHLREEFGVKEVLISLGSKGSFMLTDEGAFFSPALKLPVKSAVGAGDSFVAGYVWERSRGASYLEAFKLANACGNAAVLTEGTRLCRAEDVEKLYPQIRVERI